MTDGTGEIAEALKIKIKPVIRNSLFFNHYGT
jgi:hypothetical protein